MKKKYWHGAHTTHRHMYHIVWLPKYRKKVLEGEVKRRVEEILKEVAVMNGWEIQELNIQVEHVHLMMQIPPSISVSTAVQFLKGKSSKVVREEFPEIKKYLWGKSFWADGYFSVTVGEVSEEKIRAYIKNQ
jgi:putative transposase